MEINLIFRNPAVIKVLEMGKKRVSLKDVCQILDGAITD